MVRKEIEVVKSREEFDKKFTEALTSNVRGTTKKSDDNTIRITKFGKSEIWEF